MTSANIGFIRRSFPGTAREQYIFLAALPMDTFWSQQRGIPLSYSRRYLKFGAPGGIRTPNPQIRSLVLCPIELRARDEAEILRYWDRAAQI